MQVMRGATVDRSIGHIQINHRDYPETQNPYDVVPEAAAVIAQLRTRDGIKTVAPRVQATPCSQETMIRRRRAN